MAAVAPRDSGRDPEAAVRAAQEKMQALIRTAEVTGDPSAPVLQGLAAMLDAQHQLYLETVDTVRQVRQPIDKSDMDRLGRQIIQAIQLNGSLSNLRINRAAVAAVLLAAALLLAAGAFIETVIRPRADISGLSCEDQPNGGRICYMWVTPPGPASKR
jgi:hypothetical protein